jgi:hypothetical protein
VASENQFGFPIESDDVLISTLIKIGITDVKEIDLQKPSQAVALACFTAFLELLSYVNEDVIDMLKRDSLEKLDNPVSHKLHAQQQQPLMSLALIGSVRRVTSHRHTISRGVSTPYAAHL